MTISPDTHILVGDVAYRISDELKRAFKAQPAKEGYVTVTGDLASYFVQGMFHHEGFRQYLEGVGKGMDEFEARWAETEARWERERQRQWLRKGLITQK